MAVVEARGPNGKMIDLTEVNLTKSGLLIMITDPDGHQVLVHRFAWEGIIKAVEKLFEEEARQADIDNARMYAEEQRLKEKYDQTAQEVINQHAKPQMRFSVDCPTCHETMRSELTSESPFTLVCANCGQSYTVEVGRER